MRNVLNFQLEKILQAYSKAWEEVESQQLVPLIYFKALVFSNVIMLA